MKAQKQRKVVTMASEPETVPLFRPVGPKELALIRASGYTAFPPRLPDQPIFYPVLNEAYATQIARDWNARSPLNGYRGYVTRFAVSAAFLAGYQTHVVGGAIHQEYWIPAEELGAFNAQIVGRIAVIAAFAGSEAGEVRQIVVDEDG